jgi:hypothetical protein
VLFWLALALWQPWLIWYWVAILLACTLTVFLIVDLPWLILQVARRRKAQALLKKGIVPRRYGAYRLTRRRPFD